MKQLKKVKEGKRLAEWNHRKKGENAQLAKAQSEPKLSQYYGTGAIVAIGALGILHYCIYQYKKTAKETLVLQTNETAVHQPKDHKFEME